MPINWQITFFGLQNFAQILLMWLYIYAAV